MALFAVCASPAAADSGAVAEGSGKSGSSAITPYLTPVASWDADTLGADHDDRLTVDPSATAASGGPGRFADRAEVTGTDDVAGAPGRRRPGTVLVARTASDGAGRAASTVRFTSGLPLASSAVTSRFGMRWHPVLGGMRAHAGIDLAAPAGAPVVATADGMVSTASWAGGYGLLVAVEHGGGRQTRYAHLSRVDVAAGQRVRKGEVIGLVGSTGRSTGPHLHYETRVNGTAVDPLRR